MPFLTIFPDWVYGLYFEVTLSFIIQVNRMGIEELRL